MEVNERTVRTFPPPYHGEQPGARVLPNKVFIRKLRPIYARAPRAVPLQEVTPLNHKVCLVWFGLVCRSISVWWVGLGDGEWGRGMGNVGLGECCWGWEREDVRRKEEKKERRSIFVQKFFFFFFFGREGGVGRAHG